MALELMNSVKRITTDHPDKFEMAYSISDVERIFNEGKIALPMGMENGSALGNEIKNLDYFFKRGIRYITLTHAKNNQICDSSYEKEKKWGGLSDFGKLLVKEMNSIGMMIDVSHVSDDTFFDIVKISNKPIKIIKINKKVEFKDGERKISIEPSKLSLDIDYELKYSNSVIGSQRNKINVYEDNLEDIFNSRTFCLYEDIEEIKKKGLAKGGSLDNAIVVKGKEILNDEGLRNKKEFVNHKILDCIGDLYTCGYRLLAKIECSQGGHHLTNELLRKDPPTIGWFGNENPFDMEATKLNLSKTAAKYTQSTISYISVVGLKTAIQQLLDIKISSIMKHSDKLAKILFSMLEESDWKSFRPTTSNEFSSHIISLTHPCANTVKSTFDQLSKKGFIFGIRNGRLRISISHYNNSTDIKYLGASLLRDLSSVSKV